MKSSQKSMKSSQKSIKPSQSQTKYNQQLQQYLHLKPYRAVQRLLQQNTFQQSFQLYNHLQQTVKSNTNQLKSLMYSKHENLHQCSQAISKIQDFTIKIKSIQDQIDLLLNSNLQQQEYCYDDTYLNNPINQIQELIISQKKFLQGLNLFIEVKHQLEQNHRNHNNNNDDDDSRLIYLQFLKVQIIQKFKHYLKSTILTKELIQQSINVIKLFMNITTLEQIQAYIQAPTYSQSQTYLMEKIKEQDTTSNDLLDLIHQKIVQSQSEGGQHSKQLTIKIEDHQIIEVIFKFKLLSLKQQKQLCYQTQNHTTNNLHQLNNKEQRVNSIYKKIYHYFCDLLQLLQEANNVKQQENQYKIVIKKLYNIFKSNIEKTVLYIGELFINDLHKQNTKRQQITNNPQINTNTNTLSFDNDLYQKILQSEQFLKVINKLQNHFHPSILRQDDLNDINLLDLIKNLWKDFYCQLINIITSKINPLMFNSYKLNTPTSLSKHTPQLAKFHSINSSTQIKQSLQIYHNNIKQFFNNFIQLLSKSRNRQQRKQIINYFLKLKEGIEKNCIQYLETTLNKIKTNRPHVSYYANQILVRQCILLYFLASTYNISWKQYLSHQVVDNQNNNFNSFIQQASYDNQRYMLNIVYSSISKQQQKSPIFYQLINQLIDSKINIKKYTKTSYIQNWQLYFDTFFSYYGKHIINHNLLIQSLKSLILNIINKKLQCMV